MSAGMAFSGASLGGSLLFGGANRGTNSASLFNDGAMQGLWGMQQQNVDLQSRMYNEQGDIALSEATRSAAKTAREGKAYRENQANTYNNSGVMLEGSPMLVLNETRRLVEEETNAIVDRGKAQARLFRYQAQVANNEGRAAILGSQMNYFGNKAAAKISDIGSKPNIGLTLGKLGGMLFGGKSGSTTNTAGLFNDPNGISSGAGSLSASAQQIHY